jgi:hypothetical protein
MKWLYLTLAALALGFSPVTEAASFDCAAATRVPRPARRMPVLMRDSTRKIAFRAPTYR